MTRTGWRRPAPAAMLSLALVLAPAAAGAGADSRTSPADRVHDVKRGDTLIGLARRYGVTVAALVTANRLPDQTVIIRSGQRLIIPRAVPTPHGDADMPSASVPTASASVAPRPRLMRPPRNLTLTLPDFGDLLPLFSWPTDGRLISAFGRRGDRWHRGVDIKGDLGARITASAPGVVVASGVEADYGRVVKIEHANGFVTVYAHNDRNLVVVGDRVHGGQRIGLIGRTGRATTEHVHFEVRHSGVAYNPLYLLPPPAAVVVEQGFHGHDGPEQ